MSEWKKSRRCETSACIEVDVIDGIWHLRNNGRPDVVIQATQEEIRAFVAGVIAGDFDA